MPSHERIPTSIHSEAFLARLMREQFRLSIFCAGAFVIALFGLPLCNYFFPEVMARRVGGFTISWLILGVLFFPYVWIIAYVFIKKSIALENAEARAVLESVPSEKTTTEPSVVPEK